MRSERRIRRPSPTSAAATLVSRRELVDAPATLGAGILLSLAQSFVLLPVPLAVRRAFDHAIPTNNRTELLIVAAAVVGLSGASGIASIASQRLVQRVTKRSTQALRERVVERVFATDLSVLDQLDPEDVHERLIGDPVRVELAINAALRQVLPSAVLFFGLLALLVSIDAPLTLAVAAAVPILSGINRMFRPSLTKAINDTQRSFEVLGRYSLTLVRSQLLLRGRGTDVDAQATVSTLITSLRDQSTDRANRLANRNALQMTGLALATAATLVLGGNAVISQRISVGALLSFFAAVALIRAPSTTLTSLGPTLLEGRLSLDRLNRFLGTPIRQRMPDLGSATLDRFDTLEMRGVSYAYDDGNVAVRDLDLSLRRGRVLALSGPNGAGKTTALLLLLGLARPSAGSITVNGMPLESLAATAFRRRLGVLFQHAQFLPGTLRANLTNGRPGARASDIEEALADAEAQSIIARLPGGIDGEIGEDFDRLSGGERQRLALARALLGRPGLIVLDEPSNHLPVAFVVRVIERIRSWPDPPAILVISHDPALLAMADDRLQLTNSRHKELTA